ncbi:MAG: ferric reductase-like transmembrane domain-containing protein [bacterium]
MRRNLITLAVIGLLVIGYMGWQVGGFSGGHISQAASTVTLAASDQSTSSSSVEAERPFSWYIVRSSGFLAYFALFIIVAFGLIMSGKIATKRIHRFTITQLHCWLSWTMLFLVAVHMIFLLFDKFIPFTIPQLLIPFLATFKPANVAFGIVAFYLLVAVVVSTRYMKWLPKVYWRLIHQSSFVAFAFVSLHGYFTGTDSHTIWAKLLYGIAGGIVVFLIGFRIFGKVNR